MGRPITHRKVKTAQPIVVLTDTELNNLIGAMRALLSKEMQSKNARMQINARGKETLKELLHTRKQLCEYYQIPLDFYD